MNVKTILLLDDDEAHLTWSNEVIKEHGFDTITASKAENALEILATKDVDLVISDLVMPNIDGREFLKRVAKIKPAQKAIILTGHGDIDTYIESLYNLGALEYIAKPIKIEELIGLIKKLLNQNS